MEILIRILLAFLPGLFYIYLYRNSINKLTPISIVDTSKFLGLGLLSIIILLVFYLIFPVVTNKLLFLEDRIFIIFFYAFFQISLFEELAKFIAFKLNTKKYDVLQTQYFFAIIGMGFALIENIEYSLKITEDGFYYLSYGSIIARNLSAVPLHFLIGIITGYFVAKGKPLYGLIIGIFIHGLYDYKLMIADTKTSLLLWMILIVGCSFYIAKNLVAELKDENKIKNN